MTPAWFTRELVEGDEGDDVLIVQRKLGAFPTGVMDQQTMTRIRGFQKKHGLEETGTMTKKTAAKAGEKAAKGQTPDWYERALSEGDTGDDVLSLRHAVGQPDLPNYYDNTLADAVRRFQSEVGIKPTGKLDKSTAVALADRSV